MTKTWLGDHTLTVGILGSGSVTSDPVGIACLPTCVTSFTDGTSVTLAPVAQTGIHVPRMERRLHAVWVRAS